LMRPPAQPLPKILKLFHARSHPKCVLNGTNSPGTILAQFTPQ
jgi:hypothetical protein